jgi:hypothetical protein
MGLMNRHEVANALVAIEVAAKAVQDAAKSVQALQRDVLLEHLYKTREAELVYHDHKETMAWAGVAVFIAGTIAVATNVRKPDPWWQTHAAQQATLLLAFFVALAYTRRQFNLREWAARVSEACVRGILEIVDVGGARTSKVATTRKSRQEGRALRRWFYPPRIDARKEKNVLHATVFDLLERIESEPSKDQRPGSLEHCAYLFMLFALIVASAAIWTT